MDRETDRDKREDGGTYLMPAHEATERETERQIQRETEKERYI